MSIPAIQSKPMQDSRLGFHYFPDEDHFGQRDLNLWLPELKTLGAGWLTLRASLPKAIPETFLRALIDSDIQPILHLTAGPIRRLETAPLQSIFQAYARWGVQYVAVFSPANVRESWAPSDWPKPSLVERYLDAIHPILQLQFDTGLAPVLPPLVPGGDYWDTAFLDVALEGLARRCTPSMLGALVVGLHAYAYNRPTDWGAGGPSRWPNARPYATPEGSQDHIGFRIAEWYDARLRARLGAPRPLLCFRGGAIVGDATDRNFPAVNESIHADRALEIAELLASDALPASVLNINFWLLAAAADSPLVSQAWYRADGTPALPAVAALKQFRPATAAHSSTASRPAAARQPKTISKSAKPLSHYVLLPVYEWGISEWHWNAVRGYVKAFQPTCGFSADEASQAEYVTIVGNEQGVPADIEQRLIRAGCNVERISGPDGGAIESRLNLLAKSGQRFAALA